MQHYVLLGIVIVLTLMTTGTSNNIVDLTKLLQRDDVDYNYKFEPESDNISCTRECLPNAPPRICYYQFNLEEYATLSDACSNCINEGKSCDLPQCITADGFERAVLSVNRRIPGPGIQVCYKDRIVVDVINRMTDRTTTIHWHGIFQEGSQYYDGVPFITQCPIVPGTSFRYDFLANQPGTFYWHSHDGLQKMDGIQGSLVIRRPKESDPSGKEYDYDLPVHTIFVTDWRHTNSETLLPGLRNQEPAFYDLYYLINGRGRYKNPTTGEFTKTPYTQFFVEQGKRYRFRLTGATCRHCFARVSIQGHRLKIIATDANAIKPLEVDYIDLYTGERNDFVLTADKEVDSYWIQVAGMGECAYANIYQLALLRYVGSTDKEPTMPTSDVEIFKPTGLGLNPENSTCSERENLCVAKLEAIENFNDLVLRPKADISFTMTIGYYHPTDFELFQTKTYTRFLVPGPFSPKLILWVNNIAWTDPPSPIIAKRDDIPPGILCPTASNGIPECKEEICHCLQILRIPLGAVAEFKLIDKSDIAGVNHPFHLHGYAFNVMAMGYLKDFGNETRIEELIESKKLPYSSAPVLKDTVIVPSDGYTVVRIVANNPGYWLFHCHFIMHHVTGMSLLVQVGEPEDLPPIPKGFPECSSWNPPILVSSETTLKK